MISFHGCCEWVSIENVATEHNKNAARPGTPALGVPEEPLTHLEVAAEARDERAFLEALEAITWQNRPPADFVRAVRLALKSGAHLAARRISVEGAKYYPDDPEVQKQARVLAAPRVVSGHVPPDPARKANREWLEAHGGEYRNQWVAVRNGKLLGAANSPEELVERVGSTKGVLLTRAY